MEALESVNVRRQAESDSFEWMAQFRSAVERQLKSSYMIADPEDPDDQSYHRATIDYLTDDAMKIFFEFEQEMADRLIHDSDQIQKVLNSPDYQQQLCLADTPLHVVRVYMAKPRTESEIPGPYYCRSRRLLQRHLHDAFLNHFKL